MMCLDVIVVVVIVVEMIFNVYSFYSLFTFNYTKHFQTWVKPAKHSSSFPVSCPYFKVAVLIITRVICCCCDVINYWIRSNKDYVRKKMPSKEILMYVGIAGRKRSLNSNFQITFKRIKYIVFVNEQCK